MKKFSFKTIRQAFVAACVMYMPLISMAGLMQRSRPSDVVTTEVSPVKVSTLSNGHKVVDFGRDAAGYLLIKGAKAGNYEIIIGEGLNSDGSVNYSLHSGMYNYYYTNVKDSSGKTFECSLRAVKMTGTISSSGDFRVPMTLKWQTRFDGAAHVKTSSSDPVCPFRYAEIVSLPSGVSAESLRQVMYHYPFDYNKSSFKCSNSNLNKVYDLCKWSMYADSYLGYWLDGDRERQFYQADAYVSILNSLGVFAETTVNKRTAKEFFEDEYKCEWSVEWWLYTFLTAYQDYYHSGDISTLSKYYNNICPSSSNTKYYAIPARFQNSTTGLLASPKDGWQSSIIDWPQMYRYDYDMKNTGTNGSDNEDGRLMPIENALLCQQYRDLAATATVLGKTLDAANYSAMATKIYNSYQTTFFSSSKGLYVDKVHKDGSKSSHCSIQANAAALAFDMVPADKIDKVANFVATNGMKCGTYMAHLVLEGLGRAGRTDAAIKYMTSTAKNSWMNMINEGLTTCCETWSITSGNGVVGGTPDVNHPWSCAPASIISRYVLGVKPAAPGFTKATIKPSFGDLTFAYGKVPTQNGSVEVTYTNKTLKVKIPSGMTNGATVTFAGQTKTLSAGGSCTITEAGGGSTHTHTFGAWTTNTPPTCVAAGKRTRSCTGTGCSEKEEETLPALGHDWGDWTTNKVATTTQAGERTRSCRRSGCTATEKETIPMIEVEPTPADLPSTYQLLKSIQSTASGLQYINTGVSAGKGFKAELCFEATKPSANALMLGAYASGAEAYLPMIDPNGVLTIGVGSNNRQGSGDATMSNVVVVAIADDSGYTTTMKINGSLKVTTQNNAAPTSAPLYLFASDNAKNGNVADHFLVAKLYYAKLYSNGSLVRYFVPAQEKSDKKRVGLYDLKGKSFYASVSSAFEAEGGSGGEEEPVTPPTDPTGRYTSKGTSGAWASAANWTGVTDGTYPHLATDEAVFPSTLTADTTLDLAGKSYAIAALTAADGLNANLTLKNGSVSVTDASYLKVIAAKTLTFENMTVSSSVTATNPSSDYKKGSIDPYVTGAKIVFKGANTISGLWLRNYNSGIGYVFQDGVTEVKKGFSFGGTVNPFTIDIRAARFLTSDFILPNGSVAITIAPSSLNAAGAAAWNLSGTFAPTAASTLTIDAAGLTAGTYTLIAAKTLTDNAAFATKATIQNVADGQNAELSLANNTLTLTISGSGTPEPPPVVVDTPVAGLHVWTAGDGLWTNKESWTTKPEEGCWPDHAGAIVRINSSATIELSGGNFRFAAMTNKGAAVTLKNGTLTQAKGLLQNEAASLTFENMTLVNETTAGGYADHAIRSYVDDATLAFVGDNAVRGYLLRSSNNNNTFKFQNGATTFDQGFDFGDGARTAAFVIDNATVSFGGSLPTKLFTLNIALTFGAKNSGVAPLLSFAGSFAPYSRSTLTVDATGLTAGTYTLITAGTFTDNASFATQTEVKNVASGLTATVKLAENKLTLTLVAGSDSPVIDPSSGNMTANVEATSSDAARALVKITAPEGVSQSVYESYFTLNVTKISTGNYMVEAVLNADKIEYKDTLNSFISQLGAGKSQVAIPAKAGLYYAVQKAETLSALTSAPKSAWVKANGESVNLNVTLPASAKSGFYKVLVSPTGVAK